MTNLAIEYLRDRGETVADWEGVCGELANTIMRYENHSLYVQGDGPYMLGWAYHMVLLRDGLVHDAWCEGDALPPHEWLVNMFGYNTWIEVSIDGETIFDGLCKDFPSGLVELVTGKS